LIVYFHGGGWVVGDLDTHASPCRALASATGATVISVDYRLAPEHPFPTPVDDAFAAYRDIRERAAEFGCDPDQIVVAGDSAGGHLATMVCQRALQAGLALPAAQVLIYPVCDLTRTYQSEIDFAEGLLLTTAEMDWFTGHFLTSDDQRSAASPICADSLAGLPPALVITAGFDPLRDEGEAYASALREAGVEVVHRRFASQVHGFFNMQGVGPAAHEAVGEVAGVLRAWGVGAGEVATAR
jgi:acetyl esterase